MAATSSPTEDGPRQLEVYVHWTEKNGWVFVPRPSDKPEGDPGLIVQAPAAEPPAGTQGRYILLDWKVLNPALDDAFEGFGPEGASGSRSGEGARNAVMAMRRQDFKIKGLESTIVELEACREKFKQKRAQDAGMGSAAYDQVALKAALEETKARLEAEISRADMEKLRADQIQEELHRREQATRREIQLTGERLASTFQENVNARRELESWEADIKKARAQLEAAAEDMREKRARFLQEVSQHKEDMKGRYAAASNDKKTEDRLKEEVERLARDRAAFESERQRHMDQVMVDRMRLEVEQKRHADEVHRRRLAQQEFEKTQELQAERNGVVQSELEKAREQLAGEREQQEQHREGLAMEREALLKERQQLAAERKEVSEEAGKLKQDQKPENLIRFLVDGFAVSRQDTQFSATEEDLVKDAKRSRDTSVFRDQFRVLEAALAQKSEGGKHESGFSAGSAEATDSVSSASKGIVGALLAIQGLHDAGEKKLVSELQEQLGFKASKAMHLGSAGVHGKARTHEEKSAIRRETPLTFALALVSVCCLLWSSARRRMQGAVASIRKEVQEVRRMLPSQEQDLEELQETLRVLFDTYGPETTVGQASDQYHRDKNAVLKRIEDLKRRFRPYAKSDCIGKIVEVSTKCYQAWETFEKHLVWQRRFAQQRRHSHGAQGDIRALLLASLADQDDEGATLLRELAAIVGQAAQRRAGLVGAHCLPPAGDNGATETPTRPSKRARHMATPTSPAPPPTPSTSCFPTGGAAEASEERAATPVSPRRGAF